ncbi:putative cytochrome P450 [Whalleya microplaca]|nr:putative cytochrome P450 [Whalleya microplaca]
MKSANGPAWAIPEAIGVSSSSLLVSFVSFIAFVFLVSHFGAREGPQTLRDPIPHLFNTLQFMFNNHKFMIRVRNALRDSNIIRFYLGPKTVYLVAGPQSIKAMFGRELVHDVTNQEQMTRYALPTLYKMNPDEVRRWENDKTGVTKVPIPGTEGLPLRQRLWFMYEHIYTEYLGKPQYMRPLVDTFRRSLSQALERYPTTEWTTVSIQSLCRREVAELAIGVLFGPDLIKSSPDFIDRFWAFDEHLFMLVLGLPKWMNSGPSKAHDRYVVAIEKWLDSASARFDWEGPEAETDWEPRFGGRATRELFKWMKEVGWRSEVIAATLGALAFALNSNSIPTTMWMLMEIIKDHSLLQAVREEVATVIVTDPDTGKRTIDSQKIVALPLLQSIFTETLRLRISFNIIRDVKQPIMLDGHTIAKGSLLQAPMMVVHYDEAVWSAAGHPASEFWAERHIKYTDETDTSGQSRRKRVYATAGRPSSFFPFGGGANMCPGRQFAKAEILTTIGLVVSQLDIELVGWTNSDGSPSDRAAESDLRYCGAGAMPPDRDMKVRLKRIA